MTYSTKTPILFARFFLEAPMETIVEKLSLYESCHGKSDEIDVIFFKKNPGKCPTEIKNDTSYYRGALNFQFADSIVTAGVIKRQLLVTLK